MAYFQYQNKNIYYHEIGDGVPLLLLHGNTVSSQMFEGIADLYQDEFKVVLIDFLGHGKSDRLEEFPADFWFDEAMQVIELIKCRNYGKVNIIGTSGGALAALNVALERPDLVEKVVADSFLGERSVDVIANTVPKERLQAKARQESRAFWVYCHGDDWESVVDNDTDAMLRHHQAFGDFFHKDLSEIAAPVLLTASMQDEYAEIISIQKTYEAMHAKTPNGKLHLFETGGHPAMVTNAVAFAEAAKSFLKGIC